MTMINKDIVWDLIWAAQAEGGKLGGIAAQVADMLIEGGSDYGILASCGTHRQDYIGLIITSYYGATDAPAVMVLVSTNAYDEMYDMSDYFAQLEPRDAADEAAKLLSGLDHDLASYYPKVVSQLQKLAGVKQ